LRPQQKTEQTGQKFPTGGGGGGGGGNPPRRGLRPGKRGGGKTGGGLFLCRRPPPHNQIRGRGWGQERNFRGRGAPGGSFRGARFEKKKRGRGEGVLPSFFFRWGFFFAAPSGGGGTPPGGGGGQGGPGWRGGGGEFSVFFVGGRGQARFLFRGVVVRLKPSGRMNSPALLPPRFFSHRLTSTPARCLGPRGGGGAFFGFFFPGARMGPRKWGGGENTTGPSTKGLHRGGRGGGQKYTEGGALFPGGGGDQGTTLGVRLREGPRLFFSGGFLPGPFSFLDGRHGGGQDFCSIFPRFFLGAFGGAYILVGVFNEVFFHVGGPPPRPPHSQPPVLAPGAPPPGCFFPPRTEPAGARGRKFFSRSFPKRDGKTKPCFFVGGAGAPRKNLRGRPQVGCLFFFPLRRFKKEGGENLAGAFRGGLPLGFGGLCPRSFPGGRS